MWENKPALSCNHPSVIACEPLFASVQAVSPPVLLILTNTVSFKPHNDLISDICVFFPPFYFLTKHEKQASI